MMALIDTSVLLRKLFAEPNALVEWRDITTAYASRILVVEAGRVVDRARLAGTIDDAQVAALHSELREVLHSLDIVALTEGILLRAAGPMPTSLATLDALHLATALELAPTLDVPLVVATHDAQLARAARASGFDVVGA